MGIDDIIEFANGLNGVEETFPFGPDTLVFKFGGKIFLLISLDETPLRLNAKCNPDKALELREEFPENVLPGYHMNKKHWNTIVVNNNIKLSFVKEIIEHSHNLVAGKKKKNEQE